MATFVPDTLSLALPFVVMAALDAAIQKTVQFQQVFWMAASSPAMTIESRAVNPSSFLKFLKLGCPGRARTSPNYFSRFRTILNGCVRAYIREHREFLAH